METENPDEQPQRDVSHIDISLKTLRVDLQQQWEIENKERVRTRRWVQAIFWLLAVPVILAIVQTWLQGAIFNIVIRTWGNW